MRATPVFVMWLPYRNDISELGFTHTFACGDRARHNVQVRHIAARI